MESESFSSDGTSDTDPRGYEKMDAAGEAGYIYVIREEETDFYKIGLTNNPTKRISDLKTGNPRKLIFKRIIQVSSKLQAETWLHNRLADKKATEGGGTEWFKVPYGEKANLYKLVTEELEEFLDHAEEVKRESEGSW